MAVSTPPPEIGKPCPSFKLPAVDGSTVGLQELRPARNLLVVFTCNHCPYAQAVEDRIIALARDVAPPLLQVVFICSNDATTYPDDSFDKLQARWREKGIPFPYLHDESQDVARAFGAVCTPDFFLYDTDRRLRYRGRLDDNWKEPAKVTRRELKEALDALLAGREPSAQQNPSMGCSIKWKKDD